MMIGLSFWLWLLQRAVAPALKDPERREIALLLMGGAAAIPFFYLPAFFFGSTANFTVVDTWRFWIIHLWVEGFFELFVTLGEDTYLMKIAEMLTHHAEAHQPSSGNGRCRAFGGDHHTERHRERDS
jgi:nitric oxide reductase large subunit